MNLIMRFVLVPRAFSVKSVIGLETKKSQQAIVERGNVYAKENE